MPVLFDEAPSVALTNLPHARWVGILLSNLQQAEDLDPRNLRWLATAISDAAATAAAQGLHLDARDLRHLAQRAADVAAGRSHARAESVEPEASRGELLSAVTVVTPKLYAKLPHPTAKEMAAELKRIACAGAPAAMLSAEDLFGAAYVFGAIPIRATADELERTAGAGGLPGAQRVAALLRAAADHVEHR